LKKDRFELLAVSKANPQVTEKLKAYIVQMKQSIENDPLRSKDVGSPNKF
jgi:hypothetical protein